MGHLKETIIPSRISNGLHQLGEGETKEYCHKYWWVISLYKAYDSNTESNTLVEKQKLLYQTNGIPNLFIKSEYCIG